ncbi:unnamed protein product [Phaedon cochleariae]|uniref:mannose-6-phosphate isomerase n=1 Tax=Phaedon cochleariae TaxID=80249 RepID=A0A9P0DRW8_PHACE|nr:unnamed protein product [Phaedon cochleariae]
MELKCKIQNYEWGKKGSKSKVAILYGNVNEKFVIDEDVPYAELWMGTHVNAPSQIKDTEENLSSYIKNNPSSLGLEVTRIFKNELPFLFKVLSVNKALSIQAHPSKTHAEELHSKFPDIYKDPNHKPELAIALTPFEALCGFRPISEIREFCANIPELASITKCSEECDNVEFLKKAFRAVLICEKQQITTTIDGLISRLKTLAHERREHFLAELVERLNSQFPYDNGILMVYFLNYLKLKPSEAIYLGANEPHAYLSGDCIENMACSDNVVRAGLTPKFVDVDTLCSMLIYKGEKPIDKLFKPHNEDDFTKIYKPPVKDFAVAEIRVPTSARNYQTIKRKSASIFIVINGKAKLKEGELKPGMSLFLSADQELAIIEISEDILIYQAFANV